MPSERSFLTTEEALGQLLRDGHIDVVRDAVDRVNQSIEDSAPSSIYIEFNNMKTWVHLGP